MKAGFELDRRTILLAGGAAGVTAICARAACAAIQTAPAGQVVSVTQFGAHANAGQDDTKAIQSAVDAVQRGGGGTVLIPGRFRCGNIVVSGSNVRIQGQQGWLVDARLTVAPEASNVQVADLGIVDSRGDRRAYLMDISGRNCRFSNVQLVKDPIAGGVMMYLRQPSNGCQFSGLRLKGSNGIIIQGSNHLFEQFELESTLTEKIGGDDAFAIDALDAVSENIVIRNGIVRGYSAIVSFGSAIGTRGEGPGPLGAVRNVTVENVTGDRCVRAVFIKPDALDYKWHDGLVEGVRLRNLVLQDPAGFKFRAGIQIVAGRGAIIRDVEARQIRIVARARDRGVAPTSAIDISLRDSGAPARIENVDLQVAFVDPYSGAPHSATASGYPVNHIVRIEKGKQRKGSMSNIVLDVDGRGAAVGGIFVGPELDGAITVRRAVLTQVATDPQTKRGGGGIWSNSRINLGDVTVESVKLPKFGGSALDNRRN